MTSWLLLAEAGVPEGGLFDLDATLPLMAVQVVLLTFILNSLFFRPVGRAVEERESFISTSRADAKQKLAQAERLEADLKEQLKDARQQSQKLIQEAEQEMDDCTDLSTLQPSLTLSGRIDTPVHNGMQHRKEQSHHQGHTTTTSITQLPEAEQQAESNTSPNTYHKSASHTHQVHPVHPVPKALQAVVTPATENGESPHRGMNKRG